MRSTWSQNLSNGIRRIAFQKNKPDIVDTNGQRQSTLPPHYIFNAFLT